MRLSLVRQGEGKRRQARGLNSEAVSGKTKGREETRQLQRLKQSLVRPRVVFRWGSIPRIITLYSRATQVFKGTGLFRAQKLCESRGGRPGLPVPNKPYGFCGCKARLN